MKSIRNFIQNTIKRISDSVHRAADSVMGCMAPRAATNGVVVQALSNERGEGYVDTAVFSALPVHD